MWRARSAADIGASGSRDRRGLGPARISAPGSRGRRVTHRLRNRRVVALAILVDRDPHLRLEPEPLERRLELDLTPAAVVGVEDSDVVRTCVRGPRRRNNRRLWKAQRPVSPTQTTSVRPTNSTV